MEGALNVLLFGQRFITHISVMIPRAMFLISLLLYDEMPDP